MVKGALNNGCCPDNSGGSQSVCNCCVIPMQEVLLQLIGVRVRIGTLDTTSGVFSNVTITGVDDYIVMIQQGSNTIALPICLVVGVAASEVQHVTLLPPPLESSGECECCERPVREFFDRLQTADVDSLGSAFNNLQNADIVDTGLGVVRLSRNNEYYALSTCKVSSIQNFS